MTNKQREEDFMRSLWDVCREDLARPMCNECGTEHDLWVLDNDVIYCTECLKCTECEEEERGLTLIQRND